MYGLLSRLLRKSFRRIQDLKHCLLDLHASWKGVRLDVRQLCPFSSALELNIIQWCNVIRRHISTIGELARQDYNVIYKVALVRCCGVAQTRRGRGSNT